MHNLPPSSPGSARCRLEWRPSRWQCGGQLLITALAPWALCNSALPASLHWPASLLALALGVGGAWRYARQPAQALVIPPGRGAITLDGQALEAVRLVQQGPLLQLVWGKRGRQRRRLFWPDTLGPAQRRELRLAVQARHISRSRPAMAP